MLSKEEIEYMKKFFNESITKDLINSEDLAIRFMSVALEYIDQLESDKQKLIEKLEKIKYDLEYDRRMDNYSYLSDIQEILSILKGEKE